MIHKPLSMTQNCKFGSCFNKQMEGVHKFVFTFFFFALEGNLLTISFMKNLSMAYLCNLVVKASLLQRATTEN